MITGAMANVAVSDIDRAGRSTAVVGESADLDGNRVVFAGE